MSTREDGLWGLSRGYRLSYVLAIVAMALGIALSFGVPLATRAIIDGPLRVLAGEAPSAELNALERLAAELGLGPRGSLWLGGGLVLLLSALAGLGLYLRGLLVARASEGMVRRLRERLFAHLNALPTAWIDAADTGDLVQRCTSDVETVRTFLSTQVIEIARALLLVGLVAPILFRLDATLALFALALLPFIVGFAFLFFSKIQVLFTRMDEAEGSLTTVLQENLTAIRVVRAFGRAGYEREKFGARNEEFRAHHMRFIRFLGAYWSSSDVLSLGQVGLVLVAGAHFVREGALSVGTLAAFLEYEVMIIWPVRQLGRVLSESGKALVSMRRLQEVLAVEEETHLEPEADEALPELEGAIEVEGLGFEYPGRAAALRDVHFRLKRGETLALVGPPGSGKSSLISILLRLYDYPRGSVRLDGHELSTLPRRHARRQFGVVLQEPFLYSRSVRANLALGVPDASTEMLEESTRAAAIHDSILEFTEGYETEVGERGVTLSGGQRQRIALARALLMDPPILILDDALSAVDTVTEARILAALEARRGRSTTIIVAHRLSSVLHADLILVLEAGAVVQSGRHEELVAVAGPYQRLWEVQGALEAELRADLGSSTEAGA
jgi:ATP-binding cassette subfamily B protein